MQKIKSVKVGGVLLILKCCLLGIVATLLGTVLFAVLLKFVDISTWLIAYINDAIKILAIFFMVLCLKKSNAEKLLLKAVFAGALYAVLCFIIFSILNGGFAFNLSFIYDILFAVISSAIVSVILNLLSRKTV